MLKKIKLLIFVITIIFVLFSYYDFIASPYFDIEKIDLVNKINILDSDYRDYFGKFKGKNIWDVDFAIIEEKIKEDIRVKDIKIVKELPNKIRINVEEEQPFAKLKYKGEFYFLNNYGIIFAIAEEYGEMDSVIINVKNLNEINILIKAVDELYKTNGDKLVSEVYKDEKERIVFILLDGTKIISDESIGWEKYNTAFVLYEELIREGKNLNYIDIRFVDFIVN
jgi:cell division septal protein FtsQ